MNMRVFLSGLFCTTRSYGDPAAVGRDRSRVARTTDDTDAAATTTNGASSTRPVPRRHSPRGQHAHAGGGRRFFNTRTQLPLPANCKFVLTATASVEVRSGELRCWLYSLPSKTLVSEGVTVAGAGAQGFFNAAITVIGVDATGGDTIALECLSRTETGVAGQANFNSGAISAASASTLTTY